jgi:para-nitrobenzyl esterase
LGDIVMSIQARLQQGLIEGFQDGGIYKFFGVPFAEPPIGDLRWRPPVHPSLWDGVRQAKQFGPACLQTSGAVSDMRVHRQSEDCLYLNVWTNTLNSAAEQPMMVWIHGGGNLGGAGSEEAYDGSHLAEKGVTLVTFNYRLGAFGFLAHPDVGANFGILDCVAVLSWIRNNISELGGDPNNVTIFGESAGAANIRTLLSTPSANGLFHRAIMESAGYERSIFAKPKSLAGAQANAESLFERLGSRDIETLRRVPAEVLQVASYEFSGVAQTPGSVHIPGDLAWMPIADGVTLIDNAYPGWAEQVPVLLGCTANEAQYFLKPSVVYPRIVLENLSQALAGSKSDKVLALFDEENLPTYEALDMIITTVLFTEPEMETLRIFSELGRRVYCYYFNRVSPGFRKTNELAKHTSEIRYIFGNLADDGTYDDVDRQVSNQMQEAWIAFARNGVPESQKGVLWPPYSSDAPYVAWIEDYITFRPFPVNRLMPIINSCRTSQ